MAITYSIAPNPHWVIIDNFSLLPPGAAIYTYSSLAPATFKPAYQDAAGTIPYGQPIVGFGNGTLPPIYWKFDSDNPTDTYYIRVYDNDDPSTQRFLWDYNGISGSSGGGGGTTISTIDVDNLLFNNVFYRNSGDSASPATSVTLAPGAHQGFVNDTANSNVTTNGPVSPDIIFAKNNTTATDEYSFVDFTPLGIHSLPGQSITPIHYFNYECTVAGAGETYKYIQFPVSQGVQNLSAQPVTIKFNGRCNSGSDQIVLSFRQFFGSGGAPSSDVITPIGSPITLTNTWSTTIVPVNVPDVTGKTLGSCGNDGLFLQINIPLDAVTNMDIIAPQLYVGTIAYPAYSYDTNDQIDAIINTPRTGDVRTSLNNVLLGWVLMDDGTIGSASSSATSRANKDTYALFSLIWNLFSTNQSLAPMYTAAGASVAYGASATADFVANRRLSLTRNLGRVMAGALPTAVSQAFTNVANVMTVASTASFYTGVPVRVTGGALPTPLVAGTTYYAIQLSATTMSLATTPENAIAGTAIVLTTNASGTVIVPAHGLGTFNGEETHTQTLDELVSHQHEYYGNIQNYCAAGGSSTYDTTGLPLGSTTQATGGGEAFNVMQPTVFMNVFVKL